MVRNLSVVLFLACLLLSLVSSGSVNFNPFDKKIYAHIFSTDETASFVAITDQIQVESQLVKTNLANNNLSLAQNHANKAASLLTLDIVSEVAEANEGIADKLLTEVSDLQKISSSSDEQQQMVNQLVSDINATLGEAVVVRTQQRQQDDSSNFLESGIEFLRGIFGRGSQESNDKNDKIEVNSTTQPLAFADLVDSVLINYGNAYAVDFDMTNMSNMAMMGGNPTDMMTMSGTADNISNSNNGNSMNMDSMNMSSSASSSMDVDNKTDNKTDGNYSLVDITDYQSAQALTTKAQEIFNTKLKPMAPNNSSAFITNLEYGLIELNDSIQSKDSAMDIMMIVHTQIHPNLLEAFNLPLRQG
jgi:hypothetical protein